MVIFNYIVALVRVFVPPAKKSIHGKVVLVTGAGRGIGREIAMELTKHGAVLALWDVNTVGQTKDNKISSSFLNLKGGYGVNGFHFIKILDAVNSLEKSFKHLACRW